MSWENEDHWMLADGINRLIREQRKMNEHLEAITDALLAIAIGLDHVKRGEGE